MPPHAANSSLPGIDHLVMGGLHLSLRDRVLHERVLIILGEVPIRSHEETDNEVAINIGNVPVIYIGKRNLMPADLEKRTFSPNRSNYTVRRLPSEIQGFYHGFDVPTNKTELLYIAKMLKPEFVDGDSFRLLDNMFRG